jgi:hypothetical protein
VLPIGGLKEKALAANRGGIKRILFPFENENEIEEIPTAVRKELELIPVSHVDQVLYEALVCDGPNGLDLLLEKKAFRAAARTLREDGAYVEAGENDNLIVQKLNANPDALGIFGFSFLDQNTDTIQGSYIDGVAPTFDAIADGSYPVSRPLFFYVKKAHVGVIPGMQEYLTEFTSEKTWGEDGYLSEKGLIPMPDEERQQYQSDVKALKPLMMK